MKDEFLAMISHELQSPLVAILGWTRLLRTSRTTPAMLTKSLETIERNATLQAKLIQDLLDISRISAGKLHLNLQPIKLESVIETAIASVSATAKIKGIDLRFTILDRDLCLELPHREQQPTHAKIQVLADDTRLQQVICNLLSNAIKFTPSGSVTVELSITHGEPPQSASYAEIRVIDTGIGISAEFLPHVFDRFSQAEKSGSAKGLGLGLAIAHHLVELHNGTIRADSAGEGRGATFTVKLPLPIEG
jgi:signal transduction histidine kinase